MADTFPKDKNSSEATAMSLKQWTKKPQKLITWRVKITKKMNLILDAWKMLWYEIYCQV